MSLPVDILLEILYRLPVASLVRFRCVCKTWYHIMATPWFAKSHLACQQASSSSNKYILYHDDNLCTLFTNSDPLFDSTKHSKLFYTPELFGIDFTCNNRDLEIYGACHGLVCVSRACYHIGNNIHLWNPICRKVKKLPQIETPIKDEFGLEIPIKDEFGHEPSAGMTFGYYCDDYKVIVIVYVKSTFIVFVYSLSTNSWNTIQTINFYIDIKSIDYFVCTTKFVDGTAYMLTSIELVVCYELNNKTFRVIKLPEDNDIATMEAYGETIALLETDQNYLTMWILRDKSSSSPWERKFSIAVPEVSSLRVTTSFQAVGFLPNGKYLLRNFELEGDSCVTKLSLCDTEIPNLTEFRSFTELRSRFRLPPKYPTLHGRIDSNFVESLLLFNEDNLHPFSLTEMDSTCSSTLFTLQWSPTQ
ncbi:hypothetical protein DCAR_0208736 [Daucus carota subsp. sativus]|uniref:F-box domain-containing protein n=1 Tax=Daucus carota subsp. sativus TaxID=79200 RepID=A0AAF0WJN4_DAUCS|nr:PREDICTED: putative F-box protein At1g47790 [Daucus carota subsp. sativus]WOG89498.1 hypothetical protein DCAR_0208736 [Daucus carota subsp. sativus]